MMMTTSTVLSRDELDGVGGGPSSSAFGDGEEGGANGFGTLRRSLRQINTFKNRLFRLPATPRLSRTKKVLVGRGEEMTGWNFERGSGNTTSQQPPCPSAPFQQADQGPRPTSLSEGPARAPIATVEETNFHSALFSPACSSMCDKALPDGFVGGGSCRLSNVSNTYFKTRQRPALPSFDPPDANQARNTIHEHLRTLLPSPPPILHTTQLQSVSKSGNTNGRNQQFLFLPNTSYSANGEMYSASWQTDEGNEKGNHLNSPTQSTISLLNTQSNRGNMRSLSSSSASMQRRQSRPSYQLNGLFHQPSLKSICSVPNHAASRTSILVRSNEQLSFVEMKAAPPLLFSMTEFHKEGETECSFLGREWLFKELYQTAVVEKAPVTLIQGANGSGKSAVLNQLVLNSPFFLHKGTNADTVDSGIVVGSTGSQTSLNSSTNFSSRNYEWLRMVASRVIGFHTCHLYCAATCSIPEFVRNLCSYMCASPLLRPYSERICLDERLYQLVTSEAVSLEVDPVKLFRLLVLQPLALLNIDQLKLDSCCLSPNEPQLNGRAGDDAADGSCLIVLIDGVDEAGFHRNDGDESIGWLLKQCAAEFPPWLRFIVTSSTVQPFYGLEVRRIRLDDVELDERVLRDSRLFIDYHFTINPALEERVRHRRCSCTTPEDGLMEFVEEMLRRSRGNHLFLSLLLKMIEQDRIRLKATSLSLLPNELYQLYLLHFNLNFTSLSLFHMVAPILSVILASLKPMRFKELLRVLNAGQTEPRVSEKELSQRLSLLSPMIVKLSSGVYVPLHQSFREWLLKESSETDYFVDVRYGHILLSLSLVRQGNLQAEQLFELGHHLLKANPHKYLQVGVAADMPTDRGAQIAWIRMAAGENIAEALLFSRNTFYPNSKVSRLLLLAGANPNCVFPSGESLLCGFARSGNCDMLQLLLQYGADVEYVNPQTGETPLIVAVKNNHFEATRLLHTSAARLDVVDKQGNSALVHAAQADSLPLLSFLLEAGDWGHHKSSREQAIKDAFEASARLGKVRICRYLLDCTDACLDTCSAMCIACANGQSEVVQFLLSRGATLSPNQSWNGKSALICAVESGSWDLVVNVLNTALVDLNTNHSTNEQLTPLMVAARNGHVGLVDLLINRGAALDVQDANGRTAIMHAIEGKHTSTAALLMDRGCDISVKDLHENTLIHLLAKQPNKCLINRLLKLGLSLEEKNSEELRAIEVAIKFNSQTAIDAFLASGARLRSLTWQIALECNPELLLVLTKKLLDDASILLRRKRPHEALHRFNYALQKCTELLEKCEQEAEEEDGEQEARILHSISREELGKSAIRLHPPLSSIQCQLRQYKLQTLFSIGYLKRRNNELSDALELANEVLPLIAPEDDDTRFELYMFRAKCFFDSRDVASARQDAQMAVVLKPDNVDVQNLLAVLNTPACKPLL